MLTTVNLLEQLEQLRRESYSEFLIKARLLGRSVKKTWHAQSIHDNSAEKNKFTSNTEFKEHFIATYSEAIESFINSDTENYTGIDNLEKNRRLYEELKTNLSNLQAFLAVWDDVGLSRGSELVQELFEKDKNRQLRQLVKYKGKIDKEDRYSIKITLLILAFVLSQQTNKLIGEKEERDIASFKAKKTTKDLIDFLSEHQKALNEFASSQYPDFKRDTIPLREEEFHQKKLAEIKKIGTAISSFDAPTKKKKALKYLAIFIAWIASLAAGISTGGAVYLLFPTLLIPGIVVGVLIFVVGYVANFRFFSQNLPNFLLSLVKKGGATEFINQKGKREQLSRIKKYLLLPIALFASLTVGMSSAALTYTAILSFVSKVLPMLAIFWPPLPIVIVGILAASVLVVLSVSTFNAIIEMFKKPLFSLKDIKQAFSLENIRQLTARQIFSCVIHILLIPMALFGLIYFRITAGVDLSTLTGMVSAVITGVAAFIAQIAFTVLSINKLNTALMRPFTSTETQNENPAARSDKSALSRIKSSLAWIYAPVCLISNAIGNAALVYDASPLSTAGAVACALNSLAGNIPEQDMNQIKRTQATAVIVDKLYGLENQLPEVQLPENPQGSKSSADNVLRYKNYSAGSSDSLFPVENDPQDEPEITETNRQQMKHCQP